MTDTTNQASQFMRSAVRSSAIILLLMLVASWAFGSARTTVSLAAGSAVATASFVVLAVVVMRSFSGGTRAAWVAMLGLVKMALVGYALWWLLSRGKVEPFSFLSGFSTMVMALVFEGMRAGR